MFFGFLTVFFVYCALLAEIVRSSLNTSTLPKRAFQAIIKQKEQPKITRTTKNKLTQIQIPHNGQINYYNCELI